MKLIDRLAARLLAPSAPDVPDVDIEAFLLQIGELPTEEQRAAFAAIVPAVRRRKAARPRWGLPNSTHLAGGRS